MTLLARYAAVLVFATATVLVLALALFLRAHGYTAAGELDLWGRTLLVNAGVMPFEVAATAFPPLPQIAAVGANWLVPDLGPPVLSIVVAMLAAWLVTSWFVMLRNAKFGIVVSLAATTLLAFNPLFLRAASEGSGFVLLNLGIWLLALGLFNLRQFYRVNDMMLVSVALVVLSFSHPFGAVVAVVSIPFLALSVPPDLLEKSPSGVYLVLLFPLVFAILSFIFVNWILTGDALHFLARSETSTAFMSDRNGVVFPSNMLIVAAVAATGFFGVAPIAIFMGVRTWTLRPLLLAIGGLFATLVSAIVYAALLGVVPPLALAIGPAVVIAAACAVHWPRSHDGQRAIILWLAVGLFGGTAILIGDTSLQTRQWRSAAFGRETAPIDQEQVLLAGILAGRKGVLLDAQAAPALIAMRGSADGLLSPDAFPFRMSALRREMNWPIVVVRSKMSPHGSDRVGRAFPELFDDGAPGYRKIFDGSTWRAYQAIGGNRS
ncbi:hypothetical protein GGD81_002220 [Rhodobium orientis]|uniref:Glycosyltransferase RgtA/B/C/D-like domain-containing protein n=1 Tax=Rhodobium orientis TaxID=34017 RepID=A0A327JLE7_9HYPH|nr:hypothetical protein [Rhodobium orientis]MBB4303177.1 hypothetical protein [Rhodobium orientis]MBK5951722.1 hypothetical protein [Rhodobium orientis]RAI26901.1 hypothetical protein CH339_11980 [Rhodobium orientis]